MIRCPSCGKTNTPVIGHYHYPTVDKTETIRYRKCSDCGYNFKTHEWVIPEQKERPGN